MQTYFLSPFLRQIVWIFNCNYLRSKLSCFQYSRLLDGYFFLFFLTKNTVLISIALMSYRVD